MNCKFIPPAQEHGGLLSERVPFPPRIILFDSYSWGHYICRKKNGPHMYMRMRYRFRPFVGKYTNHPASHPPTHQRMIDTRDVPTSYCHINTTRHPFGSSIQEHPPTHSRRLPEEISSIGPPFEDMRRILY